MRLDKFLSNLKYGTRTEIKKFIKNGNIIVNDCVIKNVNTVIDELEEEFYHMMANRTNQDEDFWRKACRKDFYMSAQKALELGVIDKIV